MAAVVGRGLQTALVLATFGAVVLAELDAMHRSGPPPGPLPLATVAVSLIGIAALGMAAQLTAAAPQRPNARRAYRVRLHPHAAAAVAFSLLHAALVVALAAQPEIALDTLVAMLAGFNGVSILLLSVQPGTIPPRCPRRMPRKDLLTSRIRPGFADSVGFGGVGVEQRPQGL